MDYKNFYELAEYANENWKGAYTKKEVACNAYSYLTDFEFSMESGTPTEIISELYRKVKEDDSEECRFWAVKMEEELPALNQKYSLVLKVKFGPAGLKAEEIGAMIEKLDGNEFYPVEFQAKIEECCAMGFMTKEFAKKIDYDYEGSGLHDFIADILDSENEFNENIYSFNGNLLYLEKED